MRLPSAPRWLTAYASAARVHLWDTEQIRRNLPDAGCTGEVPVVLVHGYLARKSCWLPMMHQLVAAGHGCVRTATYSVFRDSVEQAAKAVHDKIARVATEHDTGQVDVVAHSMGGIATLLAATRYGSDQHLRRVVTLGTPYGGAPLAHLAVGGPQLLRTAQQLAPDSPLLASLRDEAGDLTVPWQSLWSPRDELVPARSAVAHHRSATNQPLPPLGHVEMLFSRRVAHATLDALAA